MNIGYVLPYQAAIVVYPDGEVRLKGSRVGRDRRASESGHRPPLARTKKSQTSLKALSEKTLKKVRNFTSYARNTLKRSATAIEREYGKERCGFLTLTCPGSTYWARRIFARVAGYFARRFRQWILDNFHADGRDVPFLGVNEIQTKRAAKALHQHILIVCPDGLTWDEFRAVCQEFWYDLLCHVSDRLGVDLFQRRPGWTWRTRWKEIKDISCDIKPVRSTTAGYLGKYMGKGEDLPEGIDPNLTPSAWWYMNDAARESMNAWTVRLPIGRVSRGQLEEMNEAMEMAMKDIARDVKPLINPYTSDWIGVVAYGERDKMLLVAEDLAMIFKRFTQEIGGNAKRLRDEWSGFFSRSFASAEAWMNGSDGELVIGGSISGSLSQECVILRRYEWMVDRGLQIT